MAEHTDPIWEFLAADLAKHTVPPGSLVYRLAILVVDQLGPLVIEHPVHCTLCHQDRMHQVTVAEAATWTAQARGLCGDCNARIDAEVLG